MIPKIKTTTRGFKQTILGVAFLAFVLPATGQEQTDTLVVNVGQSSIIFVVKDRQDLETMKSYDLNAILRKISLSLEKDSTGQEVVVRQNDDRKEIVKDTTIVIDGSSGDLEGDIEIKQKGTRHFFNVDLGMNNYLEKGKFPDADNALYSVKPFGSWYVGLSSVNRTYVGGPLYLEWGPSLSWYNFKFQNEKIRVSKEDAGVLFSEDTELPDVDFKKSKLTVAYVNFSLVPVFYLGKPPVNKNDDSFDWSDRCGNFKSTKSYDQGGFRVGIGAYGGYRIGSYTKLVYDDGDKERDKNKSNFYLNNFRYGLRLQMGYRSTDFFFNYDLNELFADEKGPKLNAFSFGLIL